MQKDTARRRGPEGVYINDKHIEVISRQMMRWVRIEDGGETEPPIPASTRQASAPPSRL